MTAVLVALAVVVLLVLASLPWPWPEGDAPASDPGEDPAPEPRSRGPPGRCWFARMNRAPVEPRPAVAARVPDPTLSDEKPPGQTTRADPRDPPRPGLVPGVEPRPDAQAPRPPESARRGAASPVPQKRPGGDKTAPLSSEAVWTGPSTSSVGMTSASPRS